MGQTSQVDESNKPANASPMVQIDGVWQEFPSGSGERQVVLKDVSFSVERPETVCILGPSGCGKSTILRMVSGMHERYTAMPTRGSVRVLGRPVVGALDDGLTVFLKPVLTAWLEVRGYGGLGFRGGRGGEGCDVAGRARRGVESIGSAADSTVDDSCVSFVSYSTDTSSAA